MDQDQVKNVQSPSKTLVHIRTFLLIMLIENKTQKLGSSA